jgi:hypothetical protein
MENYRMKSFKTNLLLAGVMALTGCATINAGVDPWAREAGVTAGAPVILFGQVGRVKIYADGAKEPLKVVIVQNPSFSTSLKNATRQSAAEARAGASPNGKATYVREMEYAPAIYLRQKATHQLRIVRDDGRDTTIFSSPHTGKKYFLIDWVLVAPTFFASLAIDYATGKWQVFNAVDVDKLFPAK